MQPADNSPQQPALPSIPPAGNVQGAALPLAPPTQPPQAAAAPAPIASSSPASSQPASSPDLADDGDLIEKEWVAKVKQVMNATVQDPHEQNNQFTKLKADYLLKRYGKIIKSDE